MYKNILLIDDNNVDNFINSTFIKKCCLSESIQIFQSVTSALSYLNSVDKTFEGNNGIIFLDLNMPEMNGLDFLNEFEKFPDHIKSSFKIILLTSSLNPNDIQRVKDNPLVYKFVSKPITANFLLSLKP